MTTTEEDKFSLIVANQTFVRILDSLDVTNIQTYRITKVSTQHVNGQYALTVTGNRIWQDMNTETYPFQRSWKSVPAGDLVSELLDYSQFQVGATIAANTTPIDLVTSKFDSVLSLIQEVGDRLDLDIDIDETTSPETIDLITKGNNNGVRFEVGHSIPGLSVDTDREKVRNQIYPVGTGEPGATCAGAIFEIQSVSTDTVTVKGDKCIPSDDTFTDGFKVEMISGAADGNRYTISATTRGSSPDTDTITTSTSPNFATDGVAAGDLFKFVDSGKEAGSGWLVNGTVSASAESMSIDTGTNDPQNGDEFTVAGDSTNYTVTGYSGGTLAFTPGATSGFADNAAITFYRELSYVPDLASQTEYGVRDDKVDTQIQGVNTLVNPGFMDGTYTTGLHAGLSKVSTPTVAEETDVTYIQHGSKSQKVTASSGGQGVSYTVTLDGSEYFSQMVHLFIASGSVKVKVVRGNLTFETTGTSGTGWFTEGLENMKLGAGTATVSILSNGGAAQWWLDARSFVGGAQNLSFVQYNGARELYRAAFDELEKKKSAPIEYTVPNAMDLYREDPRKFPFREINDGDTVGLIDHKQGVAVNVRVLSINKNQDDDSLRVAFASQTRLEAALRTLNRHEANDYISRKAARGAALQAASTQQQIDELNARITDLVPSQTLNTQSTSTVTSTSYNSINISAGTLKAGKYGTFTLDGNDITGLTADTLYYLYFNPTEDSSGIQASDDPATAYAQGNVWLGLARTGATANDAVQVVLSTANENQGEIKTRGVEAFDENDDKRIDIGILQDTPHSGGYNPNDWGVQINEGVLFQEGLYPAITSGSEPKYMRTLYASFGDEDEDLTYDSSTKRVVLDYVFGAGKFAGGVGSSFGLYGRETSLTMVAGSDGLAWGNRVTGSNAGTGDIVGFIADTLTQSGGTGDSIGLAVGGYGSFGAGVRATGASGNAIGIYIKTVSSTNGSAWSIYDSSNARAYFSGNVSLKGLNYVWPSSLPAGDSNFVIDASGNITFSAVGAGSVSGSGTTNYVPKWTSSTALGDSVIYDDGTNIIIGNTAPIQPEGSTAKLQLLGAGAAGSSMVIARYDNGNPPALYFFSSKNASIGSNTVLTDGNVLGQVVFLGDNGVDEGSIGASIAGIINGTPSSTSMPTDLVFRTTPVGSVIATERVRIDSSGNVGIGTSSPSVKLHIDAGASQEVARFVSSNNPFLSVYESATRRMYWQYDITNHLMNLATEEAGSGIRFMTVSTERMRIDSAGNVGIGRIPVSRFQVHDTSSTLDVYFTTDGLVDSILWLGTDFDGGASARYGHLGVDYSASQVRIGYGSSFTSSAIIIDSTNQVGVGVAPSSKFHVQDTGNTYIYVGTTSTTSATGVYFLENTSTTGAVVDYNANTNLMIVGTVQSGNVSIYTANTSRWLFDTNGHFYPNSTSYQLGTTSNKIGDVLIEKDSYVTWYSGSTAKGYMFVNSSDAMFINTNGNHPFDLQTDSVSRFKVEGDGRIALNGAAGSSVTLNIHPYTGSSAVVQLNSTSTSQFVPAQFDFYKNDNTNSAQWLGLIQFHGQDSAGNKHLFGSIIGYAPDSTNGSEDGQFEWWLSEAGAGAAQRMVLYSNGDLKNTTGVYGTISDRNLKRNIRDARSYWETYKKFRLVKYQLKGRMAFDPDHEYLGLVAQEVQQFMPGLVDGRDPNGLGLKSSIINYVTMGVVQENQKFTESNKKEIDILKEEVISLRADNTALKRQVEKLKRAA